MSDANKIIFGLADIYIRPIASTDEDPVASNATRWYRQTIETTAGTSTDALTINGVVFTQGAETAAATHAFANAAGLVTCINDATDGLDGVIASANGTLVTVRSGSAITITSVDVNFTVTDLTTWVKLGYQAEDGASQQISTEHYDLMVPEIGGEIDSMIIKQTGTVDIMLLEGDAAQMKYAIPGATYTAGTVPGTNENTVGVGGGSVTFYSLAIEGEDRSGRAVVYFYPKVRAEGPIDLKHVNNGVTTVPFRFKAFNVPTRTAGEQLWKMYHITTA